MSAFDRAPGPDGLDAGWSRDRCRGCNRCLSCENRLMPLAATVIRTLKPLWRKWPGSTDPGTPLPQARQL